MSFDLRRDRRHDILISLAVGLAAFVCTVCALMFVILALQPGEISAALNLSGLSRSPSSLPLFTSPARQPSPTPTTRPSTTRRAPSSTSTRTATSPRATPTRTASPARPSLTPLPRLSPQSPVAPNAPVEHFILGRPVLPNASRTIPSWYYLYGTTMGGDYPVHHGVEFVNPTGTALVAVADGTVETAGDDAARICGDNHKVACGPSTKFYGNVVVLRLDQTYQNQPLYILYGHMNSIGVETGQRVRAGDPLGEVGETGIAEGPHLHFEVRAGVNDYVHTRNPLLWLKPLNGYGMLAGRVLDRNGNPAAGAMVDLYDATSKEEVGYTETYGRDSMPHINSDDELQENFALGDLRAGTYLVRFKIGEDNYNQTVTIAAGRLTFIVQQAK